MKKVFISILVCAMMVTGCSSSEKESKSSKQTTAQYTQNVEELFEEDEYKELKEEYDITDYEVVDESNSDSVINSIKKAVKKHKQVIIVVSLGIIVIGSVALVIYDPAIIPTITGYLTTLLNSAEVETTIRLLESGALYTALDYCSTKDFEESFKNGVNYTVANAKKFLCNSIL